MRGMSHLCQALALERERELVRDGVEQTQLVWQHHIGRILAFDDQYSDRGMGASQWQIPGPFGGELPRPAARALTLGGYPLGHGLIHRRWDDRELTGLIA